MKKISLVFGILLISSACSMHIADSVIRPESLISSSSEKISFPITDVSSLATIENWIANGDSPSLAEISCGNSGKTCGLVKKSMNKHKIAFKDVLEAADSTSGNISLTYNRVTARDCTINNFGCSTSINSIQMVANRQQFIKPAISDYQDAASSVKAVNKYVK